jgi:hypothetical protein
MPADLLRLLTTYGVFTYGIVLLIGIAVGEMPECADG